VAFPSLIFVSSKSFNPRLQPRPSEYHIPPGHQCYVVGTKSKILHSQSSAEVTVIEGLLRRVRVVTVVTSTQRSTTPYLQYAGPIATLEFDLGRWHWTNNLGMLHSYSVSKGRSKVLYPQRQLQKPIGLK
jgi:hypothetical protein